MKSVGGGETILSARIEPRSLLEAFNLVAGIASILGLLFSALAFRQAKNASAAAREARDAVRIGTLASELETLCVRAEQLLDFLLHKRLAEASLRVGELGSLLSEIPRRARAHLVTDQVNSLLTVREQVSSIGDVIQRDPAALRSLQPDDAVIATSRRVATTLREVLGDVKSKVESEGEKK